MLLGLVYEGVGVTRAEADLIRSILQEPDNPDLDDVTIVDGVPPLAYAFTPDAPPRAPDPSPADGFLSAEVARHGGLDLRRAWRQPLAEGVDDGTWIYTLLVAPSTDELRAYAGLASGLWVTLHEKWPIEVTAKHRELSPYQAAALAAARTIWTG